MANYAFINLPPALKKLKKRNRVKSFEEILKQCVSKTLDNRWAVKILPVNKDDGFWRLKVTFITYLPDTAITDGSHGRVLLAPGQDVGFAIELWSDHLASRHGMNMFEGWAQGRIEEELADHLKKSVLYDSTGKKVPHGTCEYRTGKTFRDYLSRSFKKPLERGDQKYI